MNPILKAFFSSLKNYKTSLAGIAAGALTMFANGMKWKYVALATAIALLGLVAQDGTSRPTPQPPPAPTL